MNELRILFTRHDDANTVFLSDILLQEHRSLDDALARTLVLSTEFAVPMVKLLLKEMAMIRHRGNFGSLKKLLETKAIEYRAIQDEVEAYERVMSVDLGIRPSPCTFANFFNKKELDFEAEFMKRLVEQKQQQSTVKLVPTSNGGKLGQLRADMAKETAGAKRTARAMKPVIKAPKMMLDHQIRAIASSGSESGDEMHGLRHEFNQTVTVPSDAPCRTIKVISANMTTGEAGTSTFSTHKADKRPQLQRDPLMTKGLQRYVLSLPFDEVSEHLLDEATSLPDTFVSCQEYSNVFEPLIHLECRAQIFSAKREMAEQDPVYHGVITSITVVDEMCELTVAFSDFAAAKDICELDLLVSTTGPSKPVLGMVCKTGIVREKEIELVLRVHFSHGKHQHQFARQGSAWGFRWVCNLVTSLREYMAVQNLSLLSLHKTILDPRMSKGVALSEAQLGAATRFYGASLSLNESQARAVATALLDPNPFTLIQGPPGTGKTKAIEGLLGAVFGNTSSPGNPIPVRYDRVLICAPSNAAVDEIVRRIRRGVRDACGNRVPLRVVRIGSQDAMHEQVRDVSIDRLVEKQLEEQIGQALKMMEGQRAQIRDLKHALDTCSPDAPSRLAAIKSQLWQAKEDARGNTSFVEETRQSIRQRLLATSHAVCCTLSGAGHDLLARAGLDFNMVIIDEACQSVEPSSLIPLQYNCKKCILVGGNSYHTELVTLIA